MPNAWFYYTLPLCLSIGLFIGGLGAFRRIRRDRIYGGYVIENSGPGCGGVLFMLTGATLWLAILIASPSPWRRKELADHVFHTPPQRIERFIIHAGDPNARPLTKFDVVISDAPRIGRIADALRRAYEFSPNHPHAHWTAHVEMVTRDGTYHFQVESTGPWGRNGTLVELSSRPDGSGWNLGSSRADGLEMILQEAADSAGAR